MNNNLKIAIVVCITIAIMGLAYSLFLSPHARCVNELNKYQPKANNNLICGMRMSN